MAHRKATSRVIAATDVRAFFQESLLEASERYGLEARGDTMVYVANLLTEFARVEHLYEETSDGPGLRPLALVYGDAVHAATYKQRVAALRRLGDVALFIAGVFADSCRSKVVDVDYYIAMGGTAYGSLSESLRDTARDRVFSGIFGELSARFTEFVDVLSEVSDRINLSSDADVMRLYDVWVRTGSPRAARKLNEAGIHLSSDAARTTRH